MVDAEPPMTPGQQFGVSLRAAREHLGLSQAQAADRAGLDPSSWAHHERGDIHNPTLGTMLTLAAAVDVPLSRLVAGLSTGTGTGRNRAYRATQFVREKQQEHPDHQ